MPAGSRPKRLLMRRRPGFTLTQILIAMTLMTIIITSVVALLLSQTRFVTRVNGDVTALDQVGMAEEMMAMEIASLPPGAIQFARADSVVFRLPLSWGVICGPIDRHTKAAGGKKKSKAPIVYSTTTAMALEPAPTALGSPTPEGFALSPDGRTFTYYPVSSWTSVGLVQSTAAGEACVNRLPVAAGKSGNFRSTKSTAKISASEIGNISDYWSSPQLASLVGGTVPAERTFIFTYGTVSYYFKADGTSGMALYRSTPTGAQRVAGPFTALSGFTYRLLSGAQATTYTGGDLAQVRAIRATLPAIRVQRGAVAADTLDVQPWFYLVNVR